MINTGIQKRDIENHPFMGLSETGRTALSCSSCKSFLVNLIHVGINLLDKTREQKETKEKILGQTNQYRAKCCYCVGVSPTVSLQGKVVLEDGTSPVEIIDLQEDGACSVFITRKKKVGEPHE